jgi:hypothetical protein
MDTLRAAYPDLVSKYGEEHLIVKTVMHAANHHNITYETICQWSNFIRKQWMLKNFSIDSDPDSKEILVHLGEYYR